MSSLSLLLNPIEDETPPPKKQKTTDEASSSMDQRIAQICSLFPELDQEALNSLPKIFEFIAQKQKDNSFTDPHFSKAQTKLFFSVDVVSSDEAFVEIKRNGEDRSKQGGESKFSRVIHLTAAKVDRLAGLKILNPDNRLDAIARRKEKLRQLEKYLLDPQYVAALPKHCIEYVSKDGLNQLLSLYEDEGNDIPSFTAAITSWNLSICIPLAIKAAESIQQLHENNFLHRDIKPSNFFIKSTAPNEFTVKCGDVNFLIPIQEAANSSYAGTLHYVNFEDYESMRQGKDVKNSIQSELYAFGMTLLEMLQTTPEYILFEQEVKKSDTPAEKELKSKLFDLELLDKGICAARTLSLQILEACNDDAFTDDENNSIFQTFFIHMQSLIPCLEKRKESVLAGVGLKTQMTAFSSGDDYDHDLIDTLLKQEMISVNLEMHSIKNEYLKSKINTFGLLNASLSKLLKLSCDLMRKDSPITLKDALSSLNSVH
jgi:serine/threonine protein kinase